MIPNNPTLQRTLKERKIPSKTYKIHYNEKRISGEIDGLEAVKQAVYLILSTERYKFPIYNWNYAFEVVDLIGMPTSYVCSELKRRIPDALLQDDRILNVDNFVFDPDRSKLHVTFNVTCEYGNVSISWEVSV